MAKVASDKSATIRKIPLACADELAAVEFMEEMRRNGEAACPHCGGTDVYKMMKRGTDERNERFLWRCRDCAKQFTVRVGTVMEDSPIPLRHWCYAFWAACASKKGVSALQIKRQTGLGYKSALFLMHRIRWALSDQSAGPLTGDVEIDETFVGGKDRKRPNPDYYNKGGRAYKRGPKKGYRKTKMPVTAILQRNGDVRPFTDVTGDNLKRVIRENVDRSARIHTDEAKAYRAIGREFAAHLTVHYCRD